MQRARAQRLTGALAVALIVASGWACSFVTSFDGLTTPDAGDATPSYVGPPTQSTDDSGAVATPEDDAGDAGALVVADSAAAAEGSAGDAGVTDAGDAGSFCASLAPAPLFCDDFDETGLATPWDKVTGVGGTVALSGASYASPPFSMLVTSTADADAIDLAGYKSFTSAVTKKTFTLAFDLNVFQADTVSATSDAVLAAIQLDEAGRPAWDLQLEVTYDTAKSALDLNLSENASFTDGGHLYTGHPLTTTLPIGAWTHVSMVVVLGTSDAAALAIGTTTVASIVVNPGTVKAYPEILVGGTFAEKSAQGWTVGYDDVTFDAE